MEYSLSQVRYLTTIYELARQNADVSSLSIAKTLQVSKASVSTTMNELMRRKLVVKERYSKIYLTDRGMLVARTLAEQAECVLQNFPPLPLETTPEERRAAALALVAALPMRELQRELEAIYGGSETDGEL